VLSKLAIAYNLNYSLAPLKKNYENSQSVNFVFILIDKIIMMFLSRDKCIGVVDAGCEI